MFVLAQPLLTKTTNAMKKNHLLSLLCILTISTTSFAQLPAVVAKTEKAVFQIETFNEFGGVYSTGTGFFIDKNGTGLSAWHVLENAYFAYIKDFTGKRYRIKKISRINLDADIVEFILDSIKTDFPFITLAPTIPPKGTNVFTIGNPEVFEGVVSTGVVSGFKTDNGIRINPHLFREQWRASSKHARTGHRRNVLYLFKWTKPKFCLFRFGKEKHEKRYTC